MRSKLMTAAPLFLFLAAAALPGGCKKESPEADKPLRCYVGGTMVPVMTELARTYTNETHQEIDIDHADSGQLLIKIEQTGKGDLYVCHDPFLGGLMKKGLGSRGWTVAVVTPTIITPKGNPAKIKGLADLARPGVRLGLTHQTFSTLGHINPIMFEKAGLRQKIESNIKTRTRSGGQVRAAVEMGHLDAALVWNAVAHLRKDHLEIIPIAPKYLPDPKVDAVTSATFGRVDMSHIRVTIATLKCSKQPERAKAFAEFAASPRGRAAFDKYGFSRARPETTVAATPPARAAGKTLELYCGAGIRPAMEDAIKAYTAKTGVTVRADYAGSGILLSRLKLAKRGDIYMPGDVWYVETAKKEGLISSQRDVCYFVPVILVRKGNPKGIRGLADLGRSGIKLGLGRPEAVAIGRISEKIFAKNKLDTKAIRKNLVSYSLTVNELGLQVATNHLDAAIVWDAMAAYYKDKTQKVVIPAEQNVISTVAVGVLKFSKDQKLADSFVSFLASDEGRDIFRKNNYTVDRPR